MSPALGLGAPVAQRRQTTLRFEGRLALGVSGLPTPEFGSPRDQNFLNVFLHGKILLPLAMAAILGILSSAATTPAVRSTTTLTLLLTALAGPRTAALSLSLPGGRWFRERGAATQTRVAVLGGGFAGLTAARTLVASHPGVEVLLCDQREFFEYTPGILRAWVEPSVHPRLVNPIRRLLRGRRASFRRVPPGCAVAVEESTVEAALPATSDEPTRPLRFTIGRGAISPPAGL